MVRTRCYSHIPRIMPRVYQDNSFNYNSNTVINFGSGFGDYCCPKYNGWNFVADLCSGVLQGIGLAGLYRNFSCGWGGGAGGSKQTSSNNSTNTSSKVEDKDQADLQECEKELGKLEGDPTITDANKDKIKSLYNKVKAGSEGTLKDDIYSLTNQAHYKRMLASLEKLYTFDKDGNPTKKTNNAGNTDNVSNASNTGNAGNAGDAVSNDPYKDFFKDITWNTASLPASGYLNDETEFPDGFEYATKNTDFSKMTLKHAHDGSEKTGDVSATTNDINGNVSYISPEKTQGFPTYLVITDTKGSYKYHLAGVVDGKAIYNTPTTDENNNHYVLMKKGNELYLRQCGNPDNVDDPKNMKGFGQRDTQCN